MDWFSDLYQSMAYSLATGVVIPLIFAVLIALCKPTSARRIRNLAMWGTVLPIGWFLLQALIFHFDHGSSINSTERHPWFPQAGIEFSFGMDTISFLLVALTVLLGPICVLASFTAITERPRTYYAWLLVLQGAMVGVFVARDLILFYTFFEFTLVPLYILINLYGSTNRKAAATKFFLYTFTGSMITLAGLVYVAWVHRHAPGGSWSMDFGVLMRTAREMSFREQQWVFWALLAGFAIKVPIFPVHTWLPLAHTEAPTAGSVILAGVLLKLGTYGIYRFALGFTPAAATYYAPTLAVLAIIGIVYAGLICWVQTDVKKLVAYSSVSHLGYCVLGMFALNSVGLTGSVLYMINHGLSTGALFLLIGMIYERYHTRSLKEMGGLAKRMPIWASFMVFFAMASVGLPGLNGFVSEVMCMLGAFQADTHRWGTLPGATQGELGPWYAFAAGTGVIITAMYLLYMLGRIVWGPLEEPGGHGAHGHGHDAHGGHDEGHGVLPRDLSGREIGILLPLAALCLFLGLYPGPLLKVLEEPTASVAANVQMFGRDRLHQDDPRWDAAHDVNAERPSPHRALENRDGERIVPASTERPAGERRSGGGRGQRGERSPRTAPGEPGATSSTSPTPSEPGAGHAPEGGH